MKFYVFGVPVIIDFRAPLSVEETLAQYQQIREATSFEHHGELSTKEYKKALNRGYELFTSLVDDFGYKVSERAAWLLEIEDTGEDEEVTDRGPGRDVVIGGDDEDGW